jgi:tetratricopeptide (TPR) repeat protein
MEPGMNTAKQTGWARAAFCVALVISTQIGPSFAHAQAANRKAQAEGHYDQGKAYYKAGAFDLAVKEFLAGYELDPRAGVLFNVARAFEELKNPSKAIEYYKKYTDLGAAATAANVRSKRPRTPPFVASPKKKRLDAGPPRKRSSENASRNWQQASPRSLWSTKNR